ncbi:shikimate dehydrogenase [Thiorhodovibrio frisius]|uniref:Shikimate dehydrogenase (NADP(+)) n=1 Tax=Thiorhodovibrio frisius TaxID=631362 RepID=H8Z7F1_9GAMM|nr:shikimate dehydrogenase [Thiorhodovibrio frisius]EIC20881.1 shikimate 5-dehydrogenase [Thiorhodovibrio frisius]WPL21936.1 Shikimate dehydrogenase [Thiorhodovibrio frisius]
MTDRYAVIGNPIAHSKSPAIHAAFAHQTEQDMDYDRILGNPDDFAGDVRAFVAAGGRGLNVTVPFKELAWELLDDLSERARVARAVNTLAVSDGGLLHGDNTDGIGLIRDLAENQGFSFAGRSVLLVGAGGAARGVLLPLLETGVAALTIANRTVEKALALAEAMRAAGPVSGCGLDQLWDQRFDLIINATSSGLHGSGIHLPSHCLAERGWVYDMYYSDTLTPFCRWGQEQGARRVIDGLGMLVEQAAESFLLWRGLRPDTAPVINALREGQL